MSRLGRKCSSKQISAGRGMREIIYANRFIDDVARIYSERVLAMLDRRLESIESFPAMGNPCVRASLVERFGPNLRTFPVPPFAIVYRYDEGCDRLEFLALPYDKTVR